LKAKLTNRSLNMRAIRIAFLSCFIAISALDACLADDLRPVLEARYAAMKAAIANRDGNALATVLAPDFVSVGVDGGEITGARMIQTMSAAPVDPKRVGSTTLLAVEANGGNAIVKQRYIMKTVKPAADGAQQQVELTTVSTDVWVLTNGTWLIQRTATDEVDYVVDGKPLVHKTRKSE
jgi:hypothetical protein